MLLEPELLSPLSHKGREVAIAARARARSG
jgi:hypothetical protein